MRLLPILLIEDLKSLKPLAFLIDLPDKVGQKLSVVPNLGIPSLSDLGLDDWCLFAVGVGGFTVSKIHVYKEALLLFNLMKAINKNE